MSKNVWRVISVPTLLVGLASPLLVDCGGKMPGGGGLPGVGDASCSEMESGNFADIKVDAKIKGFMSAAFDLQKVAGEMEADLVAACGKLGTDLGMSEAETKADVKGDGTAADKVCGAVAAKVSAAMKANAEAKISIQVQPPRCNVDVEAAEKCFAECGAVVEPGKLEASCEGGEVSGSCEGKCSGSCTAEAGAKCSGSCSGSCSGACDAGFSGKCGGKCDGKCNGADSKGAACSGTCEGKCDASAEGSCSGSCNGTCSASCKMKAEAKCEGSCSGGCDVKMKAPKCSGEFKPPSVDATCQANCSAKLAGQMKCDPPGVRIVASGKASAETDKLVGALRGSLPAILKVSLGTGKRLAASAEGLVKAGADAAGSVGGAGLKAIACVKAAGEASAKASASINVNVKASASVSGSAQGST